VVLGAGNRLGVAVAASVAFHVAVTLSPSWAARSSLSPPLSEERAPRAAESTSIGLELPSVAEGLALEVGTDVARTRDVLGRLRRLGIVTEDPNGTEMTLDLARLLEFMEFLENPRQRGA